jgi:hypothetical protein
MNKKSIKRLCNKRNKTLKRRKTMRGGKHNVKLDLKIIKDFAYVFPMDPETKKAQIYLVAYYDTDQEASIDGYQEYIGIVESKDIKERTFKFIPYLSREYIYGKGNARDEYTRWEKGIGYQIFSFDEIDIYSFN